MVARCPARSERRKPLGHLGEAAMGWKLAPALVAAWLLGQPLAALAGELGELLPGMSREQVVAALGPPDAVRLERNGVVCLTYELNRPWILAHAFGARTGLVALKENRLVHQDVVRTGAARFACSHVAGWWDPPSRAPIICDGRWRRC
jgi:hypothetical protein